MRVFNSEVSSPSVCAVTVTYGRRQCFVRTVLEVLLKERSIGTVVLVNNGAQWNVRALSQKYGPSRVVVVELDTNQGSAAGYSAGISRAYELGAELIWLLDDDNKPEEDSLNRLLGAYNQLSSRMPKDALAVMAFRPLHRRDIDAGVPLRRVSRRRSSFLGFHVFDVPYKLWRRTRWGHPRAGGVLPPLVEMQSGSYGGLLFHRAVVERHGLPRADFVLYADDTEFTYRISRAGGAVWLVTSARIIDLGVSWNDRDRFGNSLKARLMSASDLRIFYGVRNQTYLDSHCFPHNASMFWVNMEIYSLMLWLLSVVVGRRERYRLICDAIRDGLGGRLGGVSNLLP